MQVLEREVAKDETELVGQNPPELVHDGDRRAAVRTFVVAVLDQRHRCGRRPLDVVALADRHYQTGDTALLCVARHLMASLRPAGSRGPR